LPKQQYCYCRAAKTTNAASEKMTKQKVSKIGFTKDGITSRILYNEKLNVTLFGFDKDQELSTHTSAYPALLQVTEGKMQITISGKAEILSKGEIIFLPQNKPHAVFAITKAKMLLTLGK
jgi:quercetin dioxygenase-like cupin family protein